VACRLGERRQDSFRPYRYNDLPRKRGDVDCLNDEGRDDWELVTITPNAIAYFNRAIAPAPKPHKGKAPKA
jgi:hypothetical protein